MVNIYNIRRQDVEEINIKKIYSDNSVNDIVKGDSVVVDDHTHKSYIDTSILSDPRFLDFDPFLDIQCVSKEKSDNVNDKENREDGDFIVDVDNEINEVEMDMSDFSKHADLDVEFTGYNKHTEILSINVPDEVIQLEVLNNDSFESGSDCDDPVEHERKRLLRELEKQGQANIEVGKTCFYVTQTMGSENEVKQMVKQHAIETRRKLKIIKNDLERVRVVCEGFIPCLEIFEIGCTSKESEMGPKIPKKIINKQNENKQVDVSPNEKVINSVGGRGKRGSGFVYTCPWVLHVSNVKGKETWMVKTFIDEHKCLQSREIVHCTSNYLAERVVGQLESNPKVPTKAIQDQLQRDLELEVSRMKAYRALKKAEAQLVGDYQEQYSTIRDYIEVLRAANPDTTVRVDVEPGNPNSNTRVFRRIYVCLGALKSGFKALGRDFLGLDGAFMKGPYPGQLLTAVGVDSNNGIYPLAYALVEAETLNSWTWFLECLGEDLDLHRNSNFTFMSDRQKGILPTIANLFPCAEHRFCLRHIHENMSKTWKGKAYKNHLWNCATATTIPHFQRDMAKFKEFNDDAFKWLTKIPPHHWSRSHFSGRAKSDMLLNNMCEVLNRRLLDGRDKPIITCLEFCREYLMRRIVLVLNAIEGCNGPLTAAATKMFESIKKDASKCTVKFNGGQKYQVNGPWGDQCVVDFGQKSCTCKRWELTGMSCKHSIAAMWNMSLNRVAVGLPENMVHPVYWLDTWKHVYSFHINPLNGKTMSPKSQIPTTLLPPKHHKPVGRPKKQRRKSVEEVESLNREGRLLKRLKTNTCGKCGNGGHNKRSCKGQGGSV